MSAHAACSPSSASMWLACAASVTKTKDVTRPSSKYAREGTAAHAVAEMTLKGDIFLPDKVTVEGDEYIVSPGMCRALNPYVGHVQNLMAVPKAVVFLEERIVVPGTLGMVWGTLDCGAFAGGEFHVVDLKFGRGVAVDPEGPQLRFYALGLAHLFSFLNKRYRHQKVTLTICQPRVGGDPLRSHTTTLGDLMDWRLKPWSGPRSPRSGTATPPKSRARTAAGASAKPNARPSPPSIRATPLRRSTTPLKGAIPVSLLMTRLRHARNTDPDTSHLAVPLNVTEQALFVLRAYGTGRHLLDEEAYARVGWKGHQRCSDLRRLKFIERCGRKNTPFGKAAYLCRITPAGVTYLAINK